MSTADSKSHDAVASKSTKGSSASRVRVTRWAWLGVLWAGNCAAWAMPGMVGPSWLIWLAPFGLFAIAWLGLEDLGKQAEQKAKYQAKKKAKGEKSTSARLRPRLARLFLLGWLAGLLHFLISLYWLSDIAQVPRWTSALGWFALSSYLALYHGVFTLLLGCLLPRPSRLLASFSAAPSFPTPQTRETNSRTHPKLADAQAKPREQWWLPPLINLGFSALVAILWIGLETLRDFVFGGFNWNGYSAPLIEQAVIAQLADLSGAIALSGLPFFVACLLWGLAARVRFRLKHNLGPRPQLDLLVLVLLAALLIQHAIPWLVREVKANEIQFKALSLQPLTSQQEKWDYDEQAGRWRQSTILRTHEKHLRLIAEGVEEARQLEFARLEKEFNEQGLTTGMPGQVSLVLLPESAYPELVHRIDGQLLPSYTVLDKQGEPVEVPHYLAELQLRHTPIVSGFNLQDNQAGGELRAYNAIIQLGAHGELSSYQKRHLVPFGEYLPLRPLLPFLHDLIPGNFDSGADDQELVLPLRSGPPGEDHLRFAPLICFEDTVPRLVRKSIAQNPQRTLLVNSTNDGWFGETAAEQHLANARFRAIELRRPLLRSGNSGGTAAVDVNGSLLDPWDRQRRQVVERELNALDQEGALFARLRIPSAQNPPETLYLRLGNWLGWLGVLALVILPFWRFAQRRKN